MGWYTRYIFPYIMDWSLRQAVFQRERHKALAPAYGKVLEVGFGTGLNLSHYPSAVTSLTTVDPNPMLPRRVAQRLAAAPMPVTHLCLAADILPFDDAGFDCVVTTWTLCSIADVQSALRSMRRVLKPAGQYLFLEHGRSDNPRTAWWQDCLNPLQRCLAGGCNLNRPISQLITEAGFEITTLERYLLAGVPRLFSKMYCGTARLAESDNS